VIKHLDTLFDEVPAVAGSSILPNGRVALILDVAALLRAVVEDAAAASRLTPLPTPPGGTP
jgi:chemotaxis protein histidine kinase CheA